MAQAQTASPATPPASGDAARQATTTEPSALDDIVVTAQRREERPQIVPITVTAFNDKAIDRLHLEQRDDDLKIRAGHDLAAQCRPRIDQRLLSARPRQPRGSN